MDRRPARMSPGARAWFLAEIRRLAQDSPAAADTAVAKLLTARRNLTDYPVIGDASLIPGTRRLVVGGYVLTIRLASGALEIAAIRRWREGDRSSVANGGPD